MPHPSDFHRTNDHHNNNRTPLLQRIQHSRIISKKDDGTKPLLPLTINELPLDMSSISNTPISPSGGKPTRRGSLLSSSRKVVSSAVRRPLRAVGRAVSGTSKRDIPSSSNRSSQSRSSGDGIILVGDEVDDDDDFHDDEEPRRDKGYGSILGNGDVEDDSSAVDGRIISSPRHQRQHPRMEPDWPVHSMERAMRTLLLVSGAFILGSKKPEWVDTVARVAEYAITAWVTCVVILLLALLQRKFPDWIPAFRGDAVGGEELLVLTTRRVDDTRRGASPRLPHATELGPTTTRAVPSSPLVSVQRDLAAQDALQQQYPREVIARTGSGDGSIVSMTEQVQMSHPALSDLYIIDAKTGDRIYANTAEPVHMSTEWFEMDMLVLIRTPDVDDPNADKGLLCNNQWVQYFRGRQRRFEFQYQMKLKKVPQDKAVYFSCELEEPIKMGIIQRAFVGAAMAFMKSTNPTFHYSITGSKERTSDGKFEKPHMSFTVEGSLDRLVVTKPGEVPPQLGTEIEEDPASIKRRKKGVPVDWNLDDTYTMALWSAYVDFLDWRVINLPGIRPFGLCSVMGTQAFYLTMYMIDNDKVNDKHYAKDMTNVVNLELGNGREGDKGPFAIRWAAANERKQKQVVQRARTSSEDQRKPQVAAEASNDTATMQDMLVSKASAEEHVCEEVEDDDDAETAAELGEGIYMRSGDSFCLRALLGSGEDDCGKGSFVSNGGGFVVLQDQDATIVIEKTRRSKKNRLIKSGDTVMFKMIQTKKKETRYLTIHRGWWLKWVLTVPSKNGFFTIYNHDGDFDKIDQVDNDHRNSSESSYLTMGCSFVLRHKRWSSYFVGVASEPSPTYGGRMLGLFNPTNRDQTGDEQYQSDEEELDEGDPDLKANKPSWMKPLVLTALEPQTLLTTPIPALPRKQESGSSDIDESILESVRGAKALTFGSERAQADVPAWIEMMSRRDRVRQLTYVVRVMQPKKEDQKSENGEYEDVEPTEKELETFVRLRTGRELAEIMRVGQSVQHYVTHDDESPRNRSRMSGVDKTHVLAAHRSLSQSQKSSWTGQRSTSPSVPAVTRDQPLTFRPQHDMPSNAEVLAAEFSFDAVPSKYDESDDESINSVEILHETDDPMIQEAFDETEEGEEIDLESEFETECSDIEAEVEETLDGSKRKKQGVLGKSKELLEKSVKATADGVVKTAKLGVKTTKLTGKAALATGKFSAKAVKGAGKLTGKAAVGTTMVAFRGTKKAVNAGKSAGRAVIAPVSRKSRKPPKAEPKMHKEKDHVAVSKSLKKMAKIEKKSASFVAGELCAPEQSRRTASGVLSRMSSLPMNAPHWKQCNDVLKAQVQHETDQDRWFLEGTSVELGVIPLSGENSRGKIIHESLVARCLWESHWREEWCGVYDSCVSFYCPLSKAPCIEIAYIDITNVRPLDAGSRSPLPGFPLIVLETAWLCHYIAFHNETARDSFGAKVEGAIEIHIKQVEESAALQEEELRKARFWQGFQSLSESSLSSGVGKWAKLSFKDRLRERSILNGRRMAFDTLDVGVVDMSNVYAFAEDLTTRALSFTLESLENNPDSFVEFLDLTSQLRILPLDEIDLSSRSNFCLLANIYHCLLQQAMLLSVNGPLHKKTVNIFMRTACYEIGGDIFSLAELYCCVLRGKLSKPVNPKPPYIEVAKKSQSYRHYALELKDPRVNFILNTGDVACPRDVPVLRPMIVEQQLNDAAAIFLQQELEIDPKKSLIILPKICEVYKGDFGGDSLSCLKFCMGGLDEGTASTIRVMMMDMSNLTIRYQQSSEQYHTSLRLRDEEIVESTTIEI